MPTAPNIHPIPDRELQAVLDYLGERPHREVRAIAAPLERIQQMVLKLEPQVEQGILQHLGYPTAPAPTPEPTPEPEAT